MATALSQNLKHIMVQKNISRKELAAKADLNIHVIHNILQGKVQEPSATKLHAITKALGVEQQQLFQEEPISTKVTQPTWQEGVEWDGVLYAEIVMLIKKKCHEKKISLGRTEQEIKKRIMHYAERIYRYSQKKQHDMIDPELVEFMLEEEC